MREGGRGREGGREGEGGREREGGREGGSQRCSCLPVFGVLGLYNYKKRTPQ